MGKSPARLTASAGRSRFPGLLIADSASGKKEKSYLDDVRLFNEARVANAIDHPGIVRIHDSGFTPTGVAFLTMEFLEGESLRTRLDRVLQLPPIDALRIARQLASALVAAHRKSVIHRDLKPDNIMLVPDPDLPGGERVKILDFGIAKIAESLSATPMHTRSDMLMGTPTYMAPEQCRGAKSVTERSDVYSLAVILYQLLSGRPPFVGDSVGELIAMHLMDPPPPLGEQVALLDQGIIDLVSRMLGKKADERPHMEAVFQELQRLELALQAKHASAARELSPVPTMVYSAVQKPEPQTALMQHVSQVAVLAQKKNLHTPGALPALSPIATAVHPVATAVHPVATAAHPAATAVHPVATAAHPAATAIHPAATAVHSLSLQPVIRQPGPGMRTVSVAASEWVQTGPAKPRSWQRAAITGGVLVVAVITTLTLMRLSEDAPSTVTQRVAKRDRGRGAAAAVRAAAPPGGSEIDGVTLGADSTTDNTPEPAEKSIDPRLVAASAAYKAEQYEKAIKAAESLVRAFPLEARWIIGMSACKLQNAALSEKILEEITELDRRDTESSLAEIRIACQRQHDLNTLHQHNPFESSAAEQYYNLKQYKQARNAAEQTLTQEPVKSWELIGRASCALREPTRASEALEHLEENPAVLKATVEALKVACEGFGYTFQGGRFRHK